MSFGIADYSGRAALGTALEAMLWTSDTSVSGVPAPSVMAHVAVKMSVGAHSLDGIGFEGCSLCFQYLPEELHCQFWDNTSQSQIIPPKHGSVEQAANCQDGLPAQQSCAALRQVITLQFEVQH